LRSCRSRQHERRKRHPSRVEHPQPPAPNPWSPTSNL
jgi:hypothetical protein